MSIVFAALEPSPGPQCGDAPPPLELESDKASLTSICRRRSRCSRRQFMTSSALLDPFAQGFSAARSTSRIDAGIASESSSSKDEMLDTAFSTVGRDQSITGFSAGGG